MSYFDNFPKIKKEEGIPGIKMNRTIAPRPVPGDVGIEFEIEAENDLPWDINEINKGGISCPITKGQWIPKEDNSLRGGVEYVTSTAVDISSVPMMVRGLYRNLEKAGSRLRYSNRCSTHVHLNASTWKVDSLAKFYVLYGMFEKVLVAWCGPKRTTNHFCLSIEDSTHTLDVFTRFLRHGEWGLGDGGKYSALNLTRLFDLGSVEIRCGDAYPDPERAIQWITFLHTLKEYSESIASPDRIPSLVSEITPEELFKELCTKGNTPLLLEVFGMFPTFNRVCYEGLREVIHLCNFPWDAWLEKINEEYIFNPFEKQVKPRNGRFNDLVINVDIPRAG